MPVEINKFLDYVMQLHNIARDIEQSIGTGTLSHAIRGAADDLNSLVKKELDRERNSTGY